ncbi:hypothetical protein [Acidocella sp.]|uniref:hypothetical protein n=1 Tax=Acidocella sp. TaxID=50710 RepID=UPI002637E2A9|nr:hypothetical protein [Acidocella sp.]MDD2794347.1 hypothetical protein [Acidocella sp.]
MLIPSQLAAMKLGVRRDWRPQPFAPAMGSAPAYAPAYSRIVSTPRVAGRNDQLADCFPTACANAVQTLIYRAGITIALSDAVAVNAYAGMTGYTPLHPASDHGTNPDTGFAWWQENALAGYRLRELTQIAPTAEGEIRAAIGARGGVLLCVELSTANQNQRVWLPDGAAGSWGGHAVWADGYDGAITNVTSWGQDFYIDRSYFEAGFVVGVYALDLVRA